MTGLAIKLDVSHEGFRGHFHGELPLDGPVAIYGASGAGKSSLLNAIAGIRPSSGTLAIDGRELHQLPPAKRKIGAVLQSSLLFPHMSVERNLQYAVKRAHNSRGIDYFEVLGRTGIDSLLKKKPATLSSGERQRVLIARAVLSSPDLLLLDEALNNLDPGRKAEVLHLLAALTREHDIPLLYVCHDINEIAQIAKYMALVSNGEFEEVGVLENVASNLHSSFATGADASTFIKCRFSEDNMYEDAAAFGLCSLEFSGGKLFIANMEAFASKRAELVVEIKARDVSIALSPSKNSSIVNIIACDIDAIQAADEQPHVMVRLKSGDDYILSRITRYSLERLQLSPGQKVFAQIKSVALPNL